VSFHLIRDKDESKHSYMSRTEEPVTGLETGRDIDGSGVGVCREREGAVG
jgi:hypothetical protein